MSDKNDSTNFVSMKDGSNFASIASEHGVVVHAEASRPTFDTSLQARSPSAVASRQNPPVELDCAVTAAAPPFPTSSNQKKRSSRSIDDSAGDILEQSESHFLSHIFLFLSTDLEKFSLFFPVQYAHR